MSRIAVLGAGTMGHALALVFALGEHAVNLTDNNTEALERSTVMLTGKPVCAVPIALTSQLPRRARATPGEPRRPLPAPHGIW